MITSRMAGAGVAIVASVVIAACGSSNNKSSSTSTASTNNVSATINGAGSTFAAPIYQQWGSTLKGQGLTVNYAAVGSGTGVADLQTATANFAGDDGALKSSEKSKMKGPVLQFPVAFGSITLSYNLSGIKSGLKLDGPTIADIFLGTVGKGKIVKWPVGTGGKGNSGVAAIVKQTPGAIGYVEQAYAIENNFTYAAVKNKAGTYIQPTIAATSAAATGVAVPADLGISTINSPNASAYPIASQTFLDVYKDPCQSGGASTTVAKGVKGFLTYAFGAGQSTLGQGGSQIPYAPLPGSLAAKDNTQLATMTCNGAAITLSK
ncbi:MAG: hypothetical protein E6G05_01625 [Actinobacteria bacterium]|nr:MAG: hypothetical protein E6G05_01625 [Actinomycetota bacterium]